MQETLDKANLCERDLSTVAITIGLGLSLCLQGIFTYDFSPILQLALNILAANDIIVAQSGAKSRKSVIFYYYCFTL